MEHGQIRFYTLGGPDAAILLPGPYLHLYLTSRLMVKKK